jgi:hypothetical protein
MSSLLGGGVCPLEGGCWVSAQLALMGGRGRGGLVLVRSLSPVPGHKVLYAHTLSSWSGWVDPGIPLLLPTGPRSSSLMSSWVPGSLASCCLFLAVVLGRCNRQGPIKKSPSEGETAVVKFLPAVCQRVSDCF